MFDKMIGALGWALLASVCIYVILRRFWGASGDSPRWLESLLNISQRHTNRLFAILVLGYTLFFSCLAVGYHLTLRKNTLDLSIYAQVLWNSLHGRLFANTLIPDAPHYLGKTFAPILLAFVPFYVLWSDPIVLIILQVVAFGLGAFPIFWFARARLGNALALVIALVYFLTPTVELMLLAEFYEIWLMIPLLGLALFFLLRRHYPGFLACLIVMLLVKEESAFIAIALGAFICLVQRERKLGLAVILLGAGWGVLILQYVVPFFRGSQSFYYFDASSLGGGRYGYLGHNLPEIFNTFITRPDVVWRAVTMPEKIYFTLHHLVPLAFLPLLGLEVAALALPTFGYTLLSQAAYQYDVVNQYRAPLLPILFFATILGLERALKWRRDTRTNARRARLLALALLLVVASGSYWMQTSERLFRMLADSRNFLPDAHAFLGHTLARTIPTDATVIAQNEYMIVLAHRQAIYEIPTLDYRQADYLMADTSRPWFRIHQGLWNAVLDSGFFINVTERDDYIVARRRTPEQNVNIRYGDQLTLLGYSMVVTQTKPWGMTLRPVLEWRADQPISESYHIVLSVVDRYGHHWVTDAREPHEGVTPTNRWRVGKIVGDQYDLRLPPTMPTDEYILTAAVCAQKHVACLSATDGASNVLGEEVEFARLRVTKNKNSFTASDLYLTNRLSVDLGELRLIGYEPPRATIAPGELLQVGLYWRARAKPRGDYLVAIQLRDANGRIAYEHVSRPAKGTYPTMEWDAGEVLLDWHDFHLPRDLASGEYQIFVGLRDAATGTRIGETLISILSVVK